jgi:N-acetylmuramoyl-L-alanine amidase
MRKINYIAIHCTATPQTTRVQSILNYWKNVLKWKRVGYHFIVDASGKVTQLSDISLPTNGVAGFNANTIHISYMGGVDSKGKPIDNRTDEQKKAMLDTIKNVLSELKKYQTNNPIIQGHYQFGANKACPCFDAKKEYSGIK